MGGDASVSSGSDMSVTGGSVSVASDGSMSGFSTGSMGVGASSLSGSVSGSLSGLVGGSGSLSHGWRRGCFVFVGLGGIWGRRECCVWWRDGDVKLWRVCECGV